MKRAKSVDEYFRDADQWRMTSSQEIKPSIIKSYVKEAIDHVDARHEIKADKSKPVVVPLELRNATRPNKNAS